MNNFEENTIPKYKKKAKNHRAEKSNHKHEYKPCLLICDSKPYPANYCTVCGRIADAKMAECEPVGNGRYRMLSPDEIYAKYPTLPRFTVDSVFAKHVKLK